MDRIEELKLQISGIQDKVQTIREQIQELSNQEDTYDNEYYNLMAELRILEQKQNSSDAVKLFLMEHSNMIHLGKAEGKIESSEGKIYCYCNKCRVPLELFEGNTGIGAYVTGECPVCKVEMDFTDSSKW